eukprot:7805343-Pyramimonas_sp.AAC.1
MPALSASDWSAVRICLRFLRLIGPLREYARAFCVRLVRCEKMPARSNVIRQHEPNPPAMPPGRVTSHCRVDR